VPNDEREIFTKLTGRFREPLQRVDQFAAVIGRRGGKSRGIATLATYIAGLCDPTSPRCHSAWQPNRGRRSTYRRGKTVQTTETTSYQVVQRFPLK
jgi:ABC-type antimicrobial peptide transport system ATPase subunit